MDNDDLQKLLETEMPLIDEIYKDILIHRNCHFAGSFPLMIEYYTQEGKGVSENFEDQDIFQVYEWEQEVKQDLSNLVLSVQEHDIVSSSHKLYKELRTLCESNNATDPFPKLIAELILAEEESEEEKAIANLVRHGSSSIPYLINLIKSDLFYNPYYPGYGLAPGLAAICLGELKAQEAIPYLFEMTGEESPFVISCAIEALIALGTPAELFLLKILRSKPVNKDNRKAFNILVQFPETPDLSTILSDWEKNL